jgi:hypothetical protein
MATENLIVSLAGILNGTKNIRFSPRPSLQSLRDRLTELPVDGGQPLRLLTMWGAIKHRVAPEDQAVDLAEVFAAKRLAELCASITDVYVGGVELYVLLEDFGVWYQDAYGEEQRTEQRIREGIDRYCTHLRGVLAFFNPGVRIRTLNATPGKDPAAYLQRLEENAVLLQRHVTSASRGDSDGVDLRAAGWRGGVKASAVAHYWNRVSALYPDATDPEILRRVSRYLATVLLYEQLGWQQTVAANAIRVAFYRPSPGTPTERTANRIHLRALARHTCSIVMPPWTSSGCLIRMPDGTVETHVESQRLLSAMARCLCQHRLILRRGDSVIRIPIAEYQWNDRA